MAEGTGILRHEWRKSFYCLVPGVKTPGFTTLPHPRQDFLHTHQFSVSVLLSSSFKQFSNYKFFSFKKDTFRLRELGRRVLQNGPALSRARGGGKSGASPSKKERKIEPFQRKAISVFTILSHGRIQ